MRPAPPVLLLALLIALPAAILAEDPAATIQAEDPRGWELMREAEGVQLSRRGDGSDGPPFRATTVVDADLFEVLAVLADDPRRTEWMSRCIESRRVAELEDGTRLIYSRTEGTWPVADRDGVVASRATIAEDGRRARIELRSVESSAVPPVAGVVRMPALVGAYELQTLGPGRTRVTYEIQVDLGGRVPGFVEGFVREQMPFETLRDLRRQVERTRSSYAAAAEALRAQLPDVASPPPPKPGPGAVCCAHPPTAPNETRDP